MMVYFKEFKGSEGKVMVKKFSQEFKIIINL
jgi:hypothetical protein